MQKTQPEGFKNTGIYVYTPVFLKASGCVSCIGPPAAFFRENDVSGFFGHAHFLKKLIFLIFDDFSKMAPQAKPLCPYERYRNSVQNPGTDVPTCPI